MKADRLNQSFIDAMQVLREAQHDGKKITVSAGKNEIHIQNFFEKILYSVKKKSTYLINKYNQQIDRNFNVAKNHVTEILKREIKTSLLIIDKIPCEKESNLDREIENISTQFVNQLLENK